MIRDSDYPCGEDIIINQKLLRVGKLINQGTDGRIHAVYSDDSMSPAVVKYFGCMYEDEAYRNALLEIEASERLKKCPYTVDMIGYCVRTDSDRRAEIFIMMDRLRCCEDIQLDVRGVLCMAADVCLALDFMQRKGLVHCDIKPSNIFLNADGRWQLGDFGCVQRKGRCLRRGSPAYCAPEVDSGGRCDTRSDIYSLGIVMYKLLSGGRFPFCPESAELMEQSEVERAIEHRLSGERIPPIEGISEELNRILLGMCEFDAGKRISSPKKLSALFREQIGRIK